MTRERAFTVGRANALLPHIRATLERIREMRRSSRSLEEKLEQLQAVWGGEVRRADHPDHDEYVRFRRAIVGIDREIVELTETELVDRGIQVPLDGLERGVVHFPTRVGGEDAYLCWALDEPQVRYWHGTNEAHSARRTVDSGDLADSDTGSELPDPQ